MTASSRRIITALLIVSYGLISACGSGLHVFFDDSHRQVPTNCSPEGERQPDAGPLASDHADCLLCQVTGQGQLLVSPVRAHSEPVAIGEVFLTSPTLPRVLDRLPGDPRAPPTSAA